METCVTAPNACNTRQIITSLWLTARAGPQALISCRRHAQEMRTPRSQCNHITCIPDAPTAALAAATAAAARRPRQPVGGGVGVAVVVVVELQVHSSISSTATYASPEQAFEHMQGCPVQSHAVWHFPGLPHCEFCAKWSSILHGMRVYARITQLWKLA